MQDKLELVKKIGQTLTDCGLDTKGAKVSLIRQVVCPLEAPKIDDSLMLMFSKQYDLSQAEKVKDFNEKVKPILEEIKIDQKRVQVSCSIKQGDFYQTVEGIQKLEGDEKFNLEHKKGEVWLVDFWATWCPPCQAPMAHNQHMLEHRGAEWADKVKIIGLSIDGDKAKLKSHVETKGWTKVDHYFIGGADKCKKDYGISGVPHVLLVDTNGKIVFKGHPASRKNLEEDFDKLLKGETLQDITSNDDEDEQEPETNMDVDLATAISEIDKNKEILLTLQSDAKEKERAEKMSRNFCVFVLEASYNISTDKVSIDYTNYRDMAGEEDDVKYFKDLYEDKIKGTFKIEVR